MTLTISINRITNFWFLTNHPYLTILDISANFLPAIELPPNLPFMSWINLSQNRLRKFKSPAGWTALATLHLGDNLLTNVCAEGLPNLYQLNVSRNQLTNLFIPPGLPSLQVIDVRFTPIVSIDLPEALAAGNLASFVAAMQSQGVQVQTFSEILRLAHPSVTGPFFQFALHGPPGNVRVWGSPDLNQWASAQETQKGSNPISLQLSRTSPFQFYRVERLAICP
jgi:Leucine-rich repeat (LRR) protein